MENKSDRGIKVKPLPLIPSLASAIKAFKPRMTDQGMLNARLAVYCGLVLGFKREYFGNNRLSTERRGQDAW